MITSRRGGRCPRRLWALILVPLAAALAVAPAATAAAAPKAASTPTTTAPTTTVFAPLPAGSPGHPVGVVLDRGYVYVGTHQAADGSPNLPSHVYRYTTDGLLTRDYTITGQAASGQGLTNMAADSRGLLYILDRHPARVITLDPATGVQRTYASIPDVPPCGSSAPNGNCSATKGDAPAYPDDLALGADGSLYVTDISQALIWRIPPGGGTPRVWLTSPELESLFGPCGVRFSDAHTVVLAQCTYGLTDPSQIATGAGRVYTIPVRADGSAGALHQIWQGKPGEAPDGIAIGASGRIYVALALGNALMTLAPDGREIARTVSQPADPVPYDNPASVTILPDGRALIANQAFLGGPVSDQVVLQTRVPDRVERLYRP